MRGERRENKERRSRTDGDTISTETLPKAMADMATEAASLSYPLSNSCTICLPPWSAGEWIVFNFLV